MEADREPKGGFVSCESKKILPTSIKEEMMDFFNEMKEAMQSKTGASIRRGLDTSLSVGEFMDLEFNKLLEKNSHREKVSSSELKDTIIVACT